MEKITIGELELCARPMGNVVNEIIDWINERETDWAAQVMEKSEKKGGCKNVANGKKT